MANGSGNISTAGQVQALVAHPTSQPGIYRKTNVKHAHCTNLKLISPERFSGSLAYSQELVTHFEKDLRDLDSRMPPLSSGDNKPFYETRRLLVVG
jgi:hypothetical protein